MLLSAKFLTGFNILNYLGLERIVVDFYNLHLYRVGREGPDGQNMSWSNVVDHCVTVAKRVAVLCDLLCISGAWKLQVVIAALVHDACKRDEIEYIRERGKTWNNFEIAYSYADGRINAAFGSGIASLASAVGHSSLLSHNLQDPLNAGRCSTQQLCMMIIHCVDDFTMGSDPVKLAENGENDFHRRMAANEANANYAHLNQEGKQHFFGQTAYGAQGFVGWRIMEFLARKISDRGHFVSGLDLPHFVHCEVVRLEGADE